MAPGLTIHIDFFAPHKIIPEPLAGLGDYSFLCHVKIIKAVQMPPTCVGLFCIHTFQMKILLRRVGCAETPPEASLL